MLYTVQFYQFYHLIIWKHYQQACFTDEYLNTIFYPFQQHKNTKPIVHCISFI